MQNSKAFEHGLDRFLNLPSCQFLLARSRIQIGVQIFQNHGSRLVCDIHKLSDGPNSSANFEGFGLVAEAIERCLLNHDRLLVETTTSS